MKKVLGYFLKVVIPLTGLSALIGSCANTPCNNDKCYDRNLSSVDPYDSGEIASWGTEEYERAKEKQLRKEYLP